MPDKKTDLSQKPSKSFLLTYKANIGLTLVILFAGVLGIMQMNETTETAGTLSFSNVAISGAGNAGTAIALGGSKDGGFAWGDINKDGYLDLAVNTSNNASWARTRIYISDPTDPANPTFTDETNNLCQGCTYSQTERCLILADINHDGEIDLIRNTSRRLEIYLNKGAADNYAFGVGTTQQPNFKLTTNSTSNTTTADIPGGMNTEGIFLADYDNDGWLDLIIENHNYGIDVYKNPNDGTANFMYVDPTSIGLPVSATDGDYGTCVDYDDDGDIDIIARKRNENDFFINGGGTFSDGQNISDAYNSNKGGVVFADFDNDGDFDLYWTDNGENQIWLNNGSGTLAASNGGSGDGEPWASAIVSAPSSGIDGAAVGDVNNDGKVDLFLSDDSGPGYLFLNNTPDGGSLSFSQANSGIDIDGNGEGVSFADYDRDGDLDLYINVHGDDNQLWRNSLNDDNYLFVDARISLGGGISRAAIGANIILKDCDGTVISGIREVPTTSGHGTDAPDLVHFGLPYGPDTTYNVAVHFVSVNGSRKIVEKSMTPADFANQILVVYDTDPSLSANCTDADGDGVFDQDDIDDDDDGIPDAIEQYCSNSSIANSNAGTGTYQDDIYWFNWTDSDFSDGLDNGDTQTFNLSDGTEIIATISNVVNLGNQGGDRYVADDMETWSGAFIHKLYNTAGSAETLHSGGSNSDDVSFAITFSASKNGRVIYPDYIFVDGESTNGLGEYIKVVTNQGNWQVLENYGAGAVYTGTGTQTLNITNTESSGAGNSIFYAQDATTFAIEINSAGGQAIGFGIYLECDTDNDGIFNHLDLDADNDGIPDLVEAGGADDDGDGRPSDRTESDGDGLVDVFETSYGSTSNLFDRDGNGANEESADFDEDGLPNWRDLDSDGDGIVDLIEAGGTDANQDGLTDGYATDTDLDGYGDLVDGDVGNDGTTENSSNSLLLTSPDLDGDGLPDAGYPNENFDNDITPNFLDIDSDGDGIVDNTEAQSSVGYQALDKNDDDNDGINNAYDDKDNNFGGKGLIPENTDLTDEPDYLDTDSDNDLQLDNIEGHDSDGNNAGDASSPANTGQANGNDIDKDGLDDGYDNHTSSPDATNSGLSPTSHPNVDGGSDRDWRAQTFLPVEWVSFQAVWQGKNSLLTWKTALELNSSHYLIQRSIGDNGLFQPLGKVMSVGNSTSLSSYQYLDSDLGQLQQGDKVFYRLKQIDIDGQFDYSHVVELAANRLELDLKIYPNPAKEFVTVEISNGTGDQFLKILSVEGKVMIQRKINSSENQVKINLETWAKGMYIVHIEDEKGSKNANLVVK